MSADECPVCFETIGAEPACWPCGHRVCRTCDARMRSKAMHACPSCRTPREGYTAESARAALAAREAEEGAERHLFFDLQPMPQEYSGIQLQRPSGPALIFFPSEAGGSGPAGILADLERSARMPVVLSPSEGDAAEEASEEVAPRDGLNALALLLSELTRPNATVESFQAHARALRSRLRAAAHFETGDRHRPRSNELH